jgi:hypothetical protein
VVAQYHYFCLTALYNKERAYLLTIENQDDIKLSGEREVYALVFSELMIFGIVPYRCFFNATTFI